MTRYGSVLVGWFMLVLVDAAGSPHGRGAAWLCGTALQANLYTVLFKFNNFRNLDVWLQSPERTRLLQELIPLVDVSTYQPDSSPPRDTDTLLVARLASERTLRAPVMCRC